MPTGELELIGEGRIHKRTKSEIIKVIEAPSAEVTSETEGDFRITEHHHSKIGIAGEEILILSDSGLDLQWSTITNYGAMDSCYIRVTDRETYEQIYLFVADVPYNTILTFSIAKIMPNKIWKLRLATGHKIIKDWIEDSYQDYEIQLVDRPPESPNKGNLKLQGIESYLVTEIPGPLRADSEWIKIIGGTKEEEDHWWFSNDGGTTEFPAFDIYELDNSGNIITRLVTFIVDTPTPYGGPYPGYSMHTLLPFSRQYEIGEALNLGLVVWGRATEEKPAPPY